MSGYLLDTNVLSEFRKGRRTHPSLLLWANSTLNEDHFISVLALGEIRKGIELIRKRDPAQAVVLEQFLERTEAEFEDRILPITNAVAVQMGTVRCNPANSCRRRLDGGNRVCSCIDLCDP